MQGRAWGLSCGSLRSSFRAYPCFFVCTGGTSLEHVRIQVRLRAGSTVFSSPPPPVGSPLLPIHPFTGSAQSHQQLLYHGPALDAGDSDEQRHRPAGYGMCWGQRNELGEPPEAALAEPFLEEPGGTGQVQAAGSPVQLASASCRAPGSLSPSQGCDQPSQALPGALQALLPPHYPPKLELVLQMRVSLSLTSKV